MLAMLVAGQLVLTVLPSTEDISAYKPYRDCVLAAASRFEPTGVGATDISDAANATCRATRLKIVRGFAADELDNVAKAIQNGGSGGDPGRQWRLTAMDRELAEDVALQVMNIRMQRKK